MSEQGLQVGERRQTENGEILALSPLPVDTRAEALDPFNWIRSKNIEWMDLQGGNFVFAAEFALMFLSLAFLTTILLGVIPSLIKWSDWGYFSWGPFLYVLMMHAFVTLPWGLFFHFQANKNLKEIPPIRLNRIKQKVAIPHWVYSEKEAKIPLWGEGLFTWVYIIYFITFGVIITPFMSGEPLDAYNWAFFQYGLTALIVESLIFIPYLLFGLKLKKKHAPRLEYVFYSWEQLVAYIEQRSTVGPSIYAKQVLLTLAVPDPEDPETAMAATSISVGHETAGIAQWESLRRFMEDGPDACPDPSNEDTLSDFKEKCRRAREEKSMGAWLWKKVGDWFFQRYLAHIITERRLNKLVPKSLPDELHEWSRPVPEGQQAKPSQALQQANKKISVLHKKKPHLTSQQLLEEYFRCSREDETLLA